MAFSAKSLRLLSYMHLVLGILAMAAGIASMNVTDYYSGLFGMGIWLGAWVCKLIEFKQLPNKKLFQMRLKLLGYKFQDRLFYMDTLRVV